MGNLSLGRFITLLTYTTIIVAILLSVDAPTFSFHFTDDVAFRAAWTTVAQIPLVYLLSTKRGPLNHLTGLSYERINWIHRFVGRMIFVSATTHMSIMLSSISLSDILHSPDDAMQIVRYGVSAYALLLWIAISSVMGVRKQWYRYFYINHWISTIIFLGMVVNHVPDYARLPVYVSVVLVVTDKCLVAFQYLWNNITLTPIRRKFKKFRRRGSRSRDEVHVLAMGHPVKMVWMPNLTGGVESQGVAESTTIIRISDVPFQWRPGQHVRIWLPRLGTLEVHPFTPANCSGISVDCQTESEVVEEHGLISTESTMDSNDMILMVKAHDGLTKRLVEYRDEWRSLPCPNASQPSSSLVAFLDGPYGDAPSWEDYDSLIMIATSTGTSYMLSILNSLEQLCATNNTGLRTQNIRFAWMNRHIEPQFEATVTNLLVEYTTALRESGVVVEVEFHVTCHESKEPAASPYASCVDPFAHLRGRRQRRLVGRPPLRIRNPRNPDDWDSDAESTHTLDDALSMSNRENSRSSEDTCVEEEPNEQRPCLAELELFEEELETSCWTRFRSSKWIKKAEKPLEVCQCAIVRQQELKYTATQSAKFLKRHYGTRPDIGGIIASATPQTNILRTMVISCGGANIGIHARAAVSQINRDFAMGRRERGVDIHTEGIS